MELWNRAKTNLGRSSVNGQYKVLFCPVKLLWLTLCDLQLYQDLSMLEKILFAQSGLPKYLISDQSFVSNL